MPQLLTRIADSLGVPGDIFIGIYVLTCGYWFVPLYSLVPTSAHNARHLFSIVVSCLMYLSLFDPKDFIELFAMCTIVYCLTFSLKTKSWMPIAVFGYVMTHFCYRLFIIQIVSLIHEKHIDPATPMMVMVIRLTTFAWNIHDGTKQEKDVIPEIKSKVIRQFPSLLEFYGFTCFFVTFIAGPALDFNDYREFILRTGAFTVIPSRTIPTLKLVGAGFCFAGLYAFLMEKYKYEFTATPEFLENYTFLERVLYMQAAGFTSRIKYYAVFKLSEGACCFAGIGYSGVNPKTKEHVWERAQGVIIRGVEGAENFKQLFASWNMKTALWLRNCVYLRMVPPGGKPGPLVTWATFMVSALWHGFHPGYYLTFGMGAAFPVLGRSARKYLRPLFLKPSKLYPYKIVYDFLGWFITWTSLNSIVAPFVIWYLKEALAAWRSVGYYSIVFLIVGFVVLDGSGGGKWIRKNVGAFVGAEPVARTITTTREKLKDQ